jgi:uncharacterized membrane protein
MDRSRPALSIEGLVLGVALGGFFDGILLHQILQWHHLLSAIRPQDARFQVAADGYFHALMYLLAAAGLWMLWRSRRRGGALTGRALTAGLLGGFGAWHVLDSVLSHWVLGIHRIRMDAAQPLAWDLLWFVAFGLAPLAAAGLTAHGRGGRRGGRFAATVAAALTVGGAGWSLRPAPGSDTTAVLFAPGAPQAEVMRAVAAADARLVWMDASGELVVLRLDDPSRAAVLYLHGAILVSGAGGAAGCLSYLET